MPSTTTADGANVVVRRQDDESLAQYEVMLRGLPSAAVYSSPPYWTAIAANADGELVWWTAHRAGEVVGALPCVVRRSDGATLINSLPWYGSHGGCTLRDAGDGEARGALLQAYRDAVEEEGALAANLIVPLAEVPFAGRYREVLKPAVEDIRIGQVTSLPEDAPGIGGALERTFTQKTRNLVRKANRQGFEERRTDDDWAWDFLIETHTANMAAVGGSPKPAQHFRSLREHLGSAVRLSIALDSGEPVAALLLLRFNDTVEYFTPAIVQDHRSRQPLSFLIWSGMVSAVESGASSWNWGGTGSAQASLHHFKAGWGAVDIPYPYLVQIRSGGDLDVEGLVRSNPYWYVHPLPARPAPQSG